MLNQQALSDLATLEANNDDDDNDNVNDKRRMFGSDNYVTLGATSSLDPPNKTKKLPDQLKDFGLWGSAGINHSFEGLRNNKL